MEAMANKFDYENMLIRIRDQKMNKYSNSDFSEDDIAIWNSAIELCYKIVERRRGKFERVGNKDTESKTEHSVSHGVRRSCTNCKYAIRFNDYNDDGKCGNPLTNAYKRDENNRTLFGGICEFHNYA